MNFKKKIFLLCKSLFFIFFVVIILDLIINLALPEKIKKKIGTTRNYSLKSEKFHHEIAPNINVPEFWGDSKYQVITNSNGMRVANNHNFNIEKDNIGFMGDSFVYGSGLDYKNHFTNIIFNTNKSYNLLNLGYVSYSPSIYFKKIEFFIKEKKIKFDKIYLFIDTSDVQDEGVFYREDTKGNIVRKWNSDKKNKEKNIKYIFKNYLKQNSFLFKFYEIFSSSTISEGPAKCLKNKNTIKNYIDYLDYERFGYAYDIQIQSNNWVTEGKNKIINYLTKIKDLLKQHNIELQIVYYPSAIDILKNNRNKENNSHYIMLNNWSEKNNIKMIDTSNDFFKNIDPITNYTKNHIICDMHWNFNGNKIIAKNILKNFK